MGDILSEVQRWRLKAEELRTAAEGIQNAVAQDTMLEMAERYERLAAHMENLATKKRAGTKK